MRVETRALNQETAPGLISLIEPDERKPYSPCATGRESSRS